jgi:hypothetical protein
MRTRLILATGALTVVAAGVTPALAAGNGQNGLTVGDCISDGFYGNEPNVVDGHIVASQSPGPKKTLLDGSVVQGNAVGDYQQMGISIPQICRGLAG